MKAAGITADAITYRSGAHLSASLSSPANLWHCPVISFGRSPALLFRKLGLKSGVEFAVPISSSTCVYLKPF